MKIALYTKAGIKCEEIIDKLKLNLDFELAEENPEYVFSFGGDGTFLDSLRKYGPDPIYVPINMGTLGFYCSWLDDDFKEVAKAIIDNNIVEAPTLDIEVFLDGKMKKYNCLNEATILNPVKTQILAVLIDDFLIETSRGTGVCVSTPTGSTAYNKSLGGSIISPTKKLFQLTNIASINNVKYRNIGNSIILDDNEVLTFKAEKGDMEHAILTVDRQTINLDGVDKIKIKISDEFVKILVPYDNNFYRRVRNAFIGN